MNGHLFNETNVNRGTIAVTLKYSASTGSARMVELSFQEFNVYAEWGGRIPDWVEDGRHYARGGGVSRIHSGVHSVLLPDTS